MRVGGSSPSGLATKMKVQQMDKQAILDDLRKNFGAGKSVLNADELAQVLGTTTKAVYSLHGRNGLPIPVLSSNGRLCVSIYDVVDWLAGETTAPKVSKPASKVPTPVPPPRRRRESMGAYLTTLRQQMDFLNELHTELERLDMIEELEEEQAKRAARDALRAAGIDGQPD
jgi:hypothetical protein